MEDTGFWTRTRKPFDLLRNTRPCACESTHGKIWILPSCWRSTVVGQDGHSQPDIASELGPEAGHKTHTRLLDAHQTPPLASAVAIAAETTPTADFEPPPPAAVSVSASQPHGPTPTAARDLASTYMGGPTGI